MQSVKSMDVRFLDRGCTMSGIYPTEKKFSKQHRKLVRMLTVITYLLCVSLVAILLSLYYLFLWNPEMNKGISELESRFTKELCSPHHQQRAEQMKQKPSDSQLDKQVDQSPSPQFVPYPMIRDPMLSPREKSLDISMNPPVVQDTSSDHRSSDPQSSSDPHSSADPQSSDSSDHHQPPSSTESEDSKRSSLSQEGSQEVLTYQDNSAMNSSSNSSEY